MNKELEDGLRNIAVIMTRGGKPNLSDEAFRFAAFIFAQAMLDKSWDMCSSEEQSSEDKANIASKITDEVARIVKTYANIELHEH